MGRASPFEWGDAMSPVYQGSGVNSTKCPCHCLIPVIGESISRCECGHWKAICRESFPLGWRIHKAAGSAAGLRTAPRLMNLPAVFCILSWRIFWLTMANRIAPEADSNRIFTNLELRILDQLINDKPAVDRKRRQLSNYLIKSARLSDYLTRNGDPPGNETIWRGFVRLIDIQLGVIMGAEIVGK